MNTLAEYADYLNERRDLIIENLDPESLDVYVFLSTRFSECDASRDRVFQFLFRSFYRLDLAGLTGEFKNEFFKKLQEHRGGNAVDLRGLAKHFYEIKRLKKDKSLQFSFVTKLAHTIDPSYPIYDDEVANAFAFSRPHYGENVDSRLNRFLEFYEWLRETYSAILSGGLMDHTMRDFRAGFPEQEPFLPDVKVLDFIFWSTGKLIRTQKLVDAPNHVFEPARRQRRVRPAE